MRLPQTVVPNVAATVTRMASIPHGTTIEAQGLVANPQASAPKIGHVDITPIVIATGQPVNPKFPSQTAANGITLRIPQDLTPFTSRITQAMLEDPNSLPREHISKQKILTTTTIFISTNPAAPLFGGGAANITFLLGEPQAPSPNPNADAVAMTAVFWIETVEEILHIPFYLIGGPPLLLRATASIPGQRVARSSVTPTFNIDPLGRNITVTFTQIQYSQNATLNFKGLRWPHVSVNTLVPADPIQIPPSSLVWK